MRAFAALLMLAACSASEAPAQAQQTPPRSAQQETVQRPAAVIDAPFENAVDTPSSPHQTISLDCAGAFTQGGTILCRTLAHAEISIDGVAFGQADEHGWAVLGFSRDNGPESLIQARARGSEITRAYAVAPRAFDVQRIDGLPQQTVTPTEPAVLARIQREAAMKREGFASQAAMTGFLDGFIWPVEGRISGRWGNQRVLNGTPSTPHFGVDIAAAAGTPIRAPAAGVVSFANADMHYEGGLVFIDHGQGLITMYLHMSRLDVAAGQRVAQGQVIGAVGASGRATGPHLCWRMRLNGRQLDPSVAIEGLEAARAELVR
jgi:murein DD-endopeptidase MepM/ murein hydrolase activator NlpD